MTRPAHGTRSASGPTRHVAPGDLIERALTRRAPLADAGTTAYRLLHRDADGTPGLTLDRFGACLVANLYDGLAPEPALLEAARAKIGAEAVYVKRRPAQASRLTAEARAALAPATPAVGQAVDETVVAENGIAYEIRPGTGLSVGLFLDMRDVRAAVRALAPGRRVLNCFAYTCAFGVAAALGGATEVVNVDVSQSVLAWGRRNYALNGLATRAEDFIFGDVFDWLSRFGRKHRAFDLVIVDPPPFATTKTSRFSITRDLGRLTALAATCLGPGGQLLMCANAAELPQAAFERAVLSDLTGARPRIERRWHEPNLDFPRPRELPPYLKVALITP
ncbi:MAG: class I SAM-dependent rRNA methyltransferase [Anaerolineales bacterium]|nr:class I SAM-dependent rRNA methyltransferase [Anaerolineales bacterium]